MVPRVTDNYRLVPRVFGNYSLVPRVFDNYSLAPRISNNYRLVPKVLDIYNLILKLFNFDNLALSEVSQHSEFIHKVSFWIFCFYLREVSWRRIFWGLWLCFLPWITHCGISPSLAKCTPWPRSCPVNVVSAQHQKMKYFRNIFSDRL